MKNRNNVRLSLMLSLSLLILAGTWGCIKQTLQHTTSATVNITQYLQLYPEKFSLLSQILTISETASFLKAYGSYTMFAPTDDAIRAYLKTINKATVNDVTPAAWKDFVRFHLLSDSIPTSRFTDGKLPSLTMYGQYLITMSININGITTTQVNRQANILQANISTGNGIIHVIDHVLLPSVLTVAQTIEANPRYSIMTQILKSTTLYDSLNYLPANNPDTTRRFLTVIAESDSAFKAAGFNTYADVKAKYSNTGNPAKPTDSLHLFMAYHTLYAANYLADIITTNAHLTIAPSQVVTSVLQGTTVLINDDYFNGIHEPGIPLIRTYSDVTATNGVIHDGKTHFGIKVRYPYAVYYDVQSMPDVTKNTAVYQHASTYTYSAAETAAIADMKFAATTTLFAYAYGSAQSTSKTSYGSDIFRVPLGVGSSNDPAWVEFRTPLLVRGTYKIWVCYYTQTQSSSGTATEASASIGIDGSTDRQLLSDARTVNFGVKRPGLMKTVNGVSVPDPDGEEAIGYKYYMATNVGSQVGRLVGVINITQTGRYWFRLTAVNNHQEANNLDMLQFIPINMDQQYPKFNPDGSLIPHP